jgi:hypothetical protein
MYLFHGFNSPEGNGEPLEVLKLRWHRDVLLELILATMQMPHKREHVENNGIKLGATIIRKHSSVKIQVLEILWWLR